MNDITLFEPTGRDMALDYPELLKYPELMGLKDRELRLCWLMGNRTSPIAGYPVAKRLKAAVAQSYGRASQNKGDAKKMLEGDIPDHIVLGIKRMASFRPSNRFRGKMMQQKIFENLEELVYVSDDDKKVMDIDDKKKYADLVIKVSGNLGEMLIAMESGFGISVRDKEKGKIKVKTSLSAVADRADERP